MTPGCGCRDVEMCPPHSWAADRGGGSAVMALSVPGEEGAAGGEGEAVTEHTGDEAEDGQTERVQENGLTMT